jgi:hypothetical protein
MHPTRIFKNPEQLYKAFESYKKDVEKQSKEWLKIQYVGKDGAKKQDGQKVPYTMEGFERYCYNNHGCVHHYFDNKEGYYDDFGTICSRIKKEIRENQIVGGMLGFYNPSITQRLNSLADTQNNNVNIEQPLFPD